MPLLGCGLLLGAFMVVACISVLVVLPSMAGIAAETAGFRSAGSIDAAFSAPPAPPLTLQNATQPGDITISLEGFGSETVAAGRLPVPIAVGTAPDGSPAAAIQISERDFLTACQQRADLCQIDPRFQNPVVDLKPGGAVVYGDVALPEFGGVSQRLGVALRLNGSQLDVMGVDIGGTLYVDPPPELQTQIAQIEQTATQFLNGAALEIDGQTFTLASVSIDETAMTVVLR